MKMRFIRMGLIPLVVLFAAATACAGDRDAATDEAIAITDADIREYRLNDEALSKWQQLQLRSASNPELSVPTSADRNAPDGVNAAAATHMARTFESTPDVAATIREGGLTAREFVLISFALYHAMAAQNAPTIPPELLTNAANVEYVAANLPRINRYYAEQVEARQRALESRPAAP